MEDEHKFVRKNMKRFYDLLEKKIALTINLNEEQELIDLSKQIGKNELNNIDRKLLKLYNNNRLDCIMSKLDEMLAVV